MRRSGGGEGKDDSRVLGDDEALKREANPMLFDEIEEFTKKGLMHANDPRNPFFISPGPDDEGLPSVAHRKRLVSYPQLWTYRKMRSFAAKIVGPNLMQHRYDKIAASFRQYFSDYRKMAGLDIEHRCVMIDDVARNLTERGYDKFAWWEGPAAAAAETTDAELATEEAQADLLNWQEEAAVRRMELTRRHTGPNTILHHLLLNYQGIVRRAQALLKSKDALITVDAFHYLGHSLITWVRRVVLDAIALDVELRHVAEKFGTIDIDPSSVYTALLMNKVAPDLIDHIQVVDEERRARKIAMTRKNRKRRAGQPDDIASEDGRSKISRTSTESAAKGELESELEGSQSSELEESQSSELEGSESYEPESYGRESSETESHGLEPSGAELHGSEPFKAESPNSQVFKGKRSTLDAHVEEGNPLKGGYQAFREEGDLNSTREGWFPENYRESIDAALSYELGDEPDRPLPNKAKKSGATPTMDEAASIRLSESEEEEEEEGEFVGKDSDPDGGLVEAENDAEGSSRDYTEIVESRYFKESELQDAFEISDSQAEQDESMTSSEAESFINDDEDNL